MIAASPAATAAVSADGDVFVWRSASCSMSANRFKEVFCAAGQSSNSNSVPMLSSSLAPLTSTVHDEVVEKKSMLIASKVQQLAHVHAVSVSISSNHMVAVSGPILHNRKSVHAKSQ
jgi:hypothetical protein